MGRVTTWGDGLQHDLDEEVQMQLASNVQEGSVFSTETAFAAVKYDSSVVAWGGAHEGGHLPSPVKAQLSKDVQHIRSTSRAFAAVKCDGNVVAWGEPMYGGNCENVWHQLVAGIFHDRSV
eukprot:gnl/MRDRNA2_/MRDRNA2_55712_c0_seq1.p2 gnl/MRDRNA2_/MRDRNA2_55712_c0~~gnl/MRDRNA2_/MRDRNA2_55712_c0_seq1.p2  ORF type:complete len:121 (-),score=21.52 gnl/MRDRNA2_/MRDRNA2_55712_c0_seq1:48-410(-)